jgi:integrative and conjugative element protein (TIGR02256 family)
VKGRLWLDPAAVRAMERCARRRPLLDTGGALFGYRNEEDVVAIAATGPGPGRRSRHAFTADHDHTQRLIDAFYEASNGTLGYLGGWHTHPLGGTAASPRDMATLLDLAKQPEVRLKRPVILIAVPPLLRRRPLRAAAWTLSAAGVPAPLTIRVEATDRSRIPPGLSAFNSA